MSTSKHTAGPWELGKLFKGADGDGITFSGGEYNIFPPLGECGPVAIVHCNESDARLIASAPELLEALKAILENPDLSRNDWCENTMAVLQSGVYAIEKATGTPTN